MKRVQKSQNNRKGVAKKDVKTWGGSLIMPKKSVKPNLLFYLVMKIASKTMVPKGGTLWKNSSLRSSKLGRNLAYRNSV